MRNALGQFVKGFNGRVGVKHTESAKAKMKGKVPWNKRQDISKTPDYQKLYLRKIRVSVIEKMGGKCVKCGFDNIHALQIDHINGDGSKERKERKYKGNFHKHVLKSILNKENRYQLLCANCNWIKKFENNE